MRLILSKKIALLFQGKLRFPKGCKTETKQPGSLMSPDISLWACGKASEYESGKRFSSKLVYGMLIWEQTGGKEGGGRRETEVEKEREGERPKLRRK